MAKKYLTAPFGYVLNGDPVEMDDANGLREVAHSMVDETNAEFHTAVDNMTLNELQKFFTDNAHTFEEK